MIPFIAKVLVLLAVSIADIALFSAIYYTQEGALRLSMKIAFWSAFILLFAASYINLNTEIDAIMAKLAEHYPR